MLPSFHICQGGSALSDFTKTVARKFAMLKKLTRIAYCAVKSQEILVICLFFSRGQLARVQMKCC